MSTSKKNKGASVGTTTQCTSTPTPLPLINTITIFDGEGSFTVIDFIREIEDLAVLVNYTDTDKIAAAFLRSAGHARQMMRDLPSAFSLQGSWNDFKSALRHYFKPTKSLHELKGQFATIRQNVGESVPTYAARVAKLAQQIRERYNTHSDPNEKIFMLKQLDDETLKYFIDGLTNGKLFVTLRNPQDLASAIAYAREAEDEIQVPTALACALEGSATTPPQDTLLEEVRKMCTAVTKLVLSQVESDSKGKRRSRSFEADRESTTPRRSSGHYDRFDSRDNSPHRRHLDRDAYERSSSEKYDDRRYRPRSKSPRPRYSNQSYSRRPRSPSPYRPSSDRRANEYYKGYRTRSQSPKN